MWEVGLAIGAAAAKRLSSQHPLFTRVFLGRITNFTTQLSRSVGTLVGTMPSITVTRTPGQFDSIVFTGGCSQSLESAIHLDLGLSGQRLFDL